jgi:5-(carboxyamino)imidazole ribonucleotide synthase
VKRDPSGLPQPAKPEARSPTPDQARPATREAGGPGPDRRQPAILPGSTIGVLGGGQLGRMFAIAARRMGYRIHILAPEPDSPAGQLADRSMTAAYDDVEAVEEFARGVDVVTFEFENVAAASADAAAAIVPVRPGGHVLHVAQQRVREKTYLAEHGFPVVPFASVNSAPDLDAALATIGCPAVFKTAAFGYDGKGQVRIDARGDAVETWRSAGEQPGILEAFVDLACELSVVAARGLDGAFAHFGVMHNTHTRHILDITLAPAPVEPRVAGEAIAIARGVMESLDVVGLLCTEFFLARDGRLLINELAPRPHNSGHLTFDASATSQFEQQLRAICGLPLGSTEQWRPAAMANLLGDLWDAGEPDWAAACEFPAVKLHLYGKREPRPGRKMGHLTATAESVDEARELVLAARTALRARGSGAGFQARRG